MDGAKSGRARFLVTTLCILIMTPMAMAAPEPRPVETEDKKAPFWDEPLLPSVDINVALDGTAPDFVWGGQSFAVTYEINNEGLAPELIHVFPALHHDSAACSVVGVSVEASTAIGEFTYYLAPDDDYDLRESFSWLDRGDDFEPSQIVPLDYVRVTMRGATTSDELGTCLMGVRVARAVGSGIGVESISDFQSIIVKEQPPTPVPMGYLAGEGGPFRPDQINDVTDPASDAVPLDVPLPVLSLAENAKVNLTAKASWDDQWDVDDHGRFFFQVDGKKLKDSAQDIAEGHGLVELWDVITLSTGTTQEPAQNRVCYIGEYVDGGLYDDIDDRESRCVTLHVSHVTELNATGLDVPSLEHLIRDALDELNSPLAAPADVTDALRTRGSVLVPLPHPTFGLLYVDAKGWQSVLAAEQGEV